MLIFKSFIYLLLLPLTQGVLIPLFFFFFRHFEFGKKVERGLFSPFLVSVRVFKEILYSMCKRFLWLPGLVSPTLIYIRGKQLG